ncbi:hypothetical protein Cgig2_011179 [Carnegiea gigantea]|uniref:Uncharacterized protein n=1 Tax=Carnegiea gigantea TaxID=171969 RepID=A0A9Q1JLY7_9CARY|nr:hypothetical protein Cgig2_011179 [Carnegiea gigantea]
MATITGGYAEDMTRSVWKAQFRGVQNLEVDFLVVDVPTTYNVILARPTLHEAKAYSLKKGGYISAPPLSSRPSSLGVPALTSKGLVASSPGPSPSLEGGMYATSSGVRRRNGGRPQSRRPPGVFEPTSPRPCVSIPLCPHDLVDSLAPWPWPPSRPPQKAPPLAGAAASSSCPPDHLSPPSASPSAVGTGSPAPQAFVAPS